MAFYTKIDPTNELMSVIKHDDLIPIIIKYIGYQFGFPKSISVYGGGLVIDGLYLHSGYFSKHLVIPTYAKIDNKCQIQFVASNIFTGWFISSYTSHHYRFEAKIGDPLPMYGWRSSESGNYCNITLIYNH